MGWFHEKPLRVGLSARAERGNEIQTGQRCERGYWESQAFIVEQSVFV